MESATTAHLLQLSASTMLEQLSAPALTTKSSHQMGNADALHHHILIQPQGNAGQILNAHQTPTMSHQLTHVSAQTTMKSMIILQTLVNAYQEHKGIQQANASVHQLHPAHPTQSGIHPLSDALALSMASI